MTARTYGQFCGLARALEIVGERWSLLVVRDLVLGPKRFTELRNGLPKIPASVLPARLNELEQWGVIRRRVLPGVDAAVVYELTEYGSELDQIVLQLALWGARSLGEPAVEDVHTVDAAILSLYTTFVAEAALGLRVSYELHYGDMVIHALIDNGVLKVAEGAYPDADLIIEPHGPAMLNMWRGDMSAAEAVSTGQVTVYGDTRHLETFTQVFHIGAQPVPARGLAVH